MTPSSSQPQTTRINKVTYLTQSTKEAAALLALGVPLKKEDPFVRVYTAKRPKGTPGEVTYQFEDKSSEFGTSANKLGEAYAVKEADKALDSKLTEVHDLSERVQRDASIRGDEDTLLLLARLREAMAILPEALIVYLRTGLDMRERLIKFVMEDAPKAGERGLVRVDKDGRTIIFSESLPLEKRRKLVS
jgi:hypothetical protein